MRFRFMAALGVVVACSSRLPHPPYAKHPTSALVAVGFPPPPAKFEFVPEQPSSDAVWIDGEWGWRGKRWRWKWGRWVVAPKGATFSPWTQVRDQDGNLFFASGTWRDAEGHDIAEPPTLARGRISAAELEDGGPERPRRRSKNDGGVGAGEDEGEADGG